MEEVKSKGKLKGFTDAILGAAQRGRTPCAPKPTSRERASSDYRARRAAGGRSAPRPWPRRARARKSAS